MSIIKWKNQCCDPNKELLDTSHPFFGLSLFPFSARGYQSSIDSWLPAVDIKEDEKTITVTADLPGIKKEDISVAVHEGVLSIRGERKSEVEKKENNFHRIERSSGVFERHLTLNVPVDESKISANYKDGVLHVTLPKVPAAPEKRITVE